jgi:hypothetical protein
VSFVFFRQVRCVFKVSRLSTHSYRCLQIKWQFVGVIAIDVSAPRFSFNEIIQARNILKLGISVQKKCGVIRIRETERMQFLEICDKIVDPLSVQEL